MSLHPKKLISAKPKPAARPTMTVFGGMFVVSKTHTRRPRIHRLEVSKPRGCGIGEKKITFPEVP